MENLLQTKLPVAQLVEKLTEWLTNTFSGLFDLMQKVGSYLMDWMTNTMLFIPALLFILLVTIAVFFYQRKNGHCQPLLSLVYCLFIIKAYGKN